MAGASSSLPFADQTSSPCSWRNLARSTCSSTSSPALARPVRMSSPRFAALSERLSSPSDRRICSLVSFSASRYVRFASSMWSKPPSPARGGAGFDATTRGVAAGGGRWPRRYQRHCTPRPRAGRSVVVLRRDRRLTLHVLGAHERRRDKRRDDEQAACPADQ